MGPAFALGALIWAVILAYAGLQSGLQELKHCRLSLLGALKGDTPDCAVATGASATSAGPAGPLPGGIHPPAPSTRAAAFMVEAKARFPLLVFEGCYSCRHQRGQYADPSAWSQHAWANAVDYRCPSKSYEDSYAAWVHQDTYRLGVAHFLTDEPGPLLTHVDFNPQGTGTPPCAAGGGTTQVTQATTQTSGNGSNVTPLRKPSLTPGRAS